MDKLDEISAAAAAAPPYGTIAAAGIQLYKKWNGAIKLLKGLFEPKTQWNSEDQTQTVIEEAKATMLYGQTVVTELFKTLYANIDQINFAERRQIITNFNLVNKVHEKLLQITARYYQEKFVTNVWSLLPEYAGPPAPKNGGQTEHDQVTRFNVYLGYLAREKAPAYIAGLNGNSGGEAWATKYTTYSRWFDFHGITYVIENLYQEAITQGITTGELLTELKQLNAGTTTTTAAGSGTAATGSTPDTTAGIKYKLNEANTGYLALAGIALFFLFGKDKAK